MTQEQKEQLYNENEKLIHKVCVEFKNTGIEHEDLFGIACIGFAKALNTFEENKSTKFTSYAYTCMKNEIKNYLRDNKFNYELEDDLSFYQKINEIDVDYFENLDVEYILNNIPDKYKCVIPNLLKQKTLQEIADEIGVTNQCISNKKQKALKILRNKLKSFDNNL